MARFASESGGLRPHSGPRLAEPAARFRERPQVNLGRLIRRGWLAVAIGVLVPFLAAAGAVSGWEVLRAGERRAGARQHGWALIATGLVVFAVRLAIFVS